MKRLIAFLAIGYGLVGLVEGLTHGSLLVGLLTWGGLLLTFFVTITLLVWADTGNPRWWQP